MMKYKVWFTGASGFIGKNLINNFDAVKYELVVLARESSIVVNQTKNPVRIIRVNFTDENDVSTKIKNELDRAGKPDFLIYNLGLTQSLRSSEYFNVNVHLTKIFFNSLISCDLKDIKIIYLSSLSALGPVSSNEVINSSTQTYYFLR